MNCNLVGLRHFSINDYDLQSNSLPDDVSSSDHHYLKLEGDFVLTIDLNRKTNELSIILANVDKVGSFYNCSLITN